MNEILYVEEFRGWTQAQARMEWYGRFFGVGIDTLAQAIETSVRSERREPIPLLATRRVDPRTAQFRPAKRDRRLQLIKEDKDADARIRFARKSCVRPEPDHSVAPAHRLAVIDLDKRIGLS